RIPGRQTIKNGARRIATMNLEKSRCAIGHRQRTAVQCRRRGKKIEARELIDARVCAMRALVSGGNDSLARGNAVELVPGVTRNYTIDASSPAIVENVVRRRCFGLFGQSQQIGDGTFAQTAET